MRKKLSDLILAGGDVEFSYQGVLYTILPWTDKGIVIGAQGKLEDSTFPDVDSLFNEYLIATVPLGDIVERITIEFTA